MSIEAGQNLLHYRLIEKIGEGGMGVVWKAIDTTLDREVAIKFLPADLANDPDRLARFEREAKLLASLRHPDIAVVHGLHEQQGMRFLAMELATGEDLARRLERGALPLDEALTIAARVAGALEAAHENGVVHRDLKPANVQVDPGGTVKVLDFGLAKAVRPVSGSGSVGPTMSPTETSAGTLAGTILGTAAYMSPEQAKGRPVDKRADVWAFGCLLLEMLTGRRTFAGDSIAETLASVMKEDPDWDRLPPDTPPAIRRLLRRCLVKDPQRRLRDVGDARIVIAEVLSGEGLEAEAGGVASSAKAPAWRRALPWGVSLVLALALAATWLGRGVGPTTTQKIGPSLRLSLLLPDEQPAFLANGDYEVMPSFAISPRGERVVYTVRGDSRTLVLRELDGFEPEPLRGSENAEGPFFSPDGSWVGFFDGSSLVKVPAAGGARIEITGGIGNGTGADWGDDGTIVFAHSYVGPLWTVSAEGGEPRPLTTLGDGERSHRYPQLLPDGKSVLFTIKPSGILSFDEAHIGIADLESGEHRVLAERGAYARYVATGHLVLARAGGLLAAPFDLESLRTTGGAVPVLDGVLMNPVTGTALFEVADNATLVYVEGDYSTGPTTLFALDRSSGTREPLAEGHYAVAPQVSPDGGRLLLHGSTANDQVLLLDLERGTLTRLTDASTNNVLPVWGPGGASIVYTTDRNGREEIVSMPVDGGPIETLVAPSGPRQEASSWSPDGTLLAYNVGPATSRDIWLLDTRTGETKPFLATSFDEGDPAFSPDGGWLTYGSDESGTTEVYASPYPGPGRKVQLTTGGGHSPRWRADGGELFYKSGATLYAMPVTWNGGPRPGRPSPVIVLSSTIPVGWTVSADGRTFYLVDLDESRWQSSRIDVVVNWTAGGR